MDKEYIIQLIFNDQIEEAIQALLQLAAEKGDASLSLQLKRISAELAGIRSREATGIISPGESEAELIKIKQDLLAGLGVFTHWEPPLLQKPDETEFESWRGPSEAKTPSANITQSEKEASAPSERVVNTGFAENEKPIDDLPANRTLATGHKYFFWLEVGKIMEKSIEKNPTPLPTEHLPEEAELEVALYTLNDACSIDAGADVGKLKLTKNDTVEVLQQPQQPFQVQVSAEIAQKRLFFPLQTATQVGTVLLKCNIYFQRILVQSREIRAEIRPQPQTMPGALTSELRYSLSFTLTAEHLKRYRAHKLSVLLSESDQNSHSFQIFGSKQFKSDASFKEGEIADALIQLRGALRKAAWGNEEEFVKNKDSYKYEKGSGSLQKLTKDLILLATRGYEFYTALIRDIAVQNQDTSPQAQVNALEDLMLEPGYVQFVLQKGANHVLPLACLYDYPLDTGLPDFKLCSNFQEALKQKQSLTLCSCFQGHCPSREDKSTICPSGFWGYRHYLGMPQSIKFIHSSPAEIFYTDKPAFAISVWKNFNSRELHVKNLTSNKRVTWKYADDRASTLTILKDKNLHLVYFYCHGGAYPSYPYLEVGDNRNYKITPSHINPNNGIYWEESHPLVFLNGCHTTGLSPERALNFVEAFVENALCAGVIGTEITIFESLASDFFEFFIERFTQGDPVAKAVRDARLHILQQYNPLGLVYIPFVMGGLQLVKKAS